MSQQRIDEVRIIPGKRAMWCVSCDSVSNSTSDDCPACGASLRMISLNRIMNPCPELGAITYVYSGAEA
jgi:hypothetical protein